MSSEAKVLRAASGGRRGVDWALGHTTRVCISLSLCSHPALYWAAGPNNTRFDNQLSSWRPKCIEQGIVGYIYKYKLAAERDFERSVWT